jgi:hypothetical protein
MTLSSRSAKLSSPNVKVQDVPDRPTIGSVAQDADIDAINVSFTPAATGGQAAIYRAVSNPGNIQAISYGSSPVKVTGLTDGTAYTFTVRGETATGSTTGYTSSSSSITPDFKAFDLITTNILSSATANVTFSSIPQTYKHLQIRMVTRGNNSSGFFAIYGSFNGNQAYSWHRVKADGSSLSSDGFGSQSVMVLGNQPNANDSSNSFAATIVDINDYTSSAKNKTANYISCATGTNYGFIHFGSGAQFDTAPITTIIIGQQGNQFVAGSRISLYGTKG